MFHFQLFTLNLTVNDLLMTRMVSLSSSLSQTPSLWLHALCFKQSLGRDVGCDSRFTPTPCWQEETRPDWPPPEPARSAAKNPRTRSTAESVCEGAMIQNRRQRQYLNGIYILMGRVHFQSAIDPFGTEE